MAIGEPAATRDITASVLEFEQELTAQGEICVGSGSIDSEPLSVSLHTSFGPPEQDKDCNQDFVIGWNRHTGSDRRVQLAVAMADGVTSSYRSEVGAETACWAALASLISREHVVGRERAQQAVGDANKAIIQLAEQINESAESFRPDDEFASTWQFKLDEGLILQTTLTLLWIEDGRLFIGMVGDGGAVCKKQCDEDGEKRVTCLNADLNDSQQVNALGPHARGPVQLDCFAEMDVSLVHEVALFTDGITRGFEDLVELLELIRQTNTASKETNVAESLIENFQSVRPAEFEDNLTLCWFSIRPPGVVGSST